MKRYCIVCENIYGCVKGEKKNDCSDCNIVHNCNHNNDLTSSQVTGGICQECWEKRHLIKMAIKIYNIAKQLNLNPAHSGIKGSCFPII